MPRVVILLQKIKSTDYYSATTAAWGAETFANFADRPIPLKNCLGLISATVAGVINHHPSA
jgi:hypothetical protein